MNSILGLAQICLCHGELMDGFKNGTRIKYTKVNGNLATYKSGDIRFPVPTSPFKTLCLVSKKISTVLITSNVRTHAWNIKCS